MHAGCIETEQTDRRGLGPTPAPLRTLPALHGPRQGLAGDVVVYEELDSTLDPLPPELTAQGAPAGRRGLWLALGLGVAVLGVLALLVLALLTAVVAAAGWAWISLSEPTLAPGEAVEAELIMMPDPAVRGDNTPDVAVPKADERGGTQAIPSR